MDQKQAIQVAEEYSNKIKDVFPVKKIVLYGSYANGTATDDSDIDIAVVVDSVSDDVLTEKVRLYQLRRNIDDRIEPVLIEDGKDPSGFLQHILNSGQKIYKSP